MCCHNTLIERVPVKTCLLEGMWLWGTSEVDTASCQREMGQGPSLYHVTPSWPPLPVASAFCHLDLQLFSRSQTVILLIPWLLLMSILKRFSKPYGCISKSPETKGNWSQTLPLSHWHTVTPHNTWAHSKRKITTPCGNNKTQLITYNVTWPLLCLQGVCASEHGNETFEENTSAVTSSRHLAPFVPTASASLCLRY